MTVSLCLAALMLVAQVLAPLAGVATAEPGTGPEAGRIGIRLIEAPASALGDPRARRYVTDHLAPGTVIRRRVEVANLGRAGATVAVYAAAADIRGGAFTMATGRDGNELSSWITPDRHQLRLPAGRRTAVTVTIAVPDTAADGERYAVVWAESAAPRPSGVSLASRVGVRIYLSVGSGAPPASRFEVQSLTAARSADGRPLVRVAVRNTGGRALDITGSLSLTDGPGGVRAGPSPVRPGITLAVGESGAVTVPLDAHLARGPWRAVVTLRSGTIQRTAQATIEFPASGSAASRRASPASTGSGRTYAAGAVLAASLLAAGGLLWRRRRRDPATR